MVGISRPMSPVANPGPQYQVTKLDKDDDGEHVDGFSNSYHPYVQCPEYSSLQKMGQLILLGVWK